MDKIPEEHWRELSEHILTDVGEWRRAHPKATLREIEEEVHRRMSRLEARVIQDTAQASTSRTWSGASPQERPVVRCVRPMECRSSTQEVEDTSQQCRFLMRQCVYRQGSYHFQFSVERTSGHDGVRDTSIMSLVRYYRLRNSAWINSLSRVTWARIKVTRANMAQKCQRRTWRRLANLGQLNKRPSQICTPPRNSAPVAR